MNQEQTAGSAFGLIIVGSEILDGRRRDAHFDTARSLLAGRRLELAYSLILPDRPETIESQLRWAMSGSDPFFCCGGIGSTPDDYTRDCAARAAGVPIARHPEGETILRARFGSACTPVRLRLVEFPAGAALIPNPVNQVPGFRIRNGHFVPGFPEMARPMMAWVLDTWYMAGPERMRSSLLLENVREADLVPLMEEMLAANPGISFSSLPSITPTGTRLELSVKGTPGATRNAFDDLTARLESLGIQWTTRP